MDETVMPLDHKQPKCIAPKGMKKVYGPSSGNKSQITILACANAVGTCYHPWLFLKVSMYIMNGQKKKISNTI